MIEFKVAKAQEFQAFKQIPKFSKPNLSVIHPPSVLKFPKPRHRPPTSMGFDGTIMRMG